MVKAVIFSSLGIFESDETKVRIVSSFCHTIRGCANDNKSVYSALTPNETKIHVSMVIKADDSILKSSTREYHDGWID